MSKRALPDDIRDFVLMFPSKYLKAADLRGKEHDVVIEEIFGDLLVSENGKTEDKWLYKYKGHKKLHVGNVTNARSIAKMYGKDPHVWVGKPVTIYPTKDRRGSETVDCIRVRETVPQIQPVRAVTEQSVSPQTVVTSTADDIEVNYLEDDVDKWGQDGEI